LEIAWFFREKDVSLGKFGYTVVMQYGNPPQFRLRRKEDISRVFADGRAKRDGLLLVLCLLNDLPEVPTRIAVTVAKRLGTAAVRNRVKRVLREALRLERPNLQHGIDLVLVPKTANLTAEQARESLVKLTTKLGIRVEAGEGGER
jgi:ribonuclease P protein component